MTIDEIAFVEAVKKQAIAARDKWWIDKIDAMFITTLSSGKEVMQHYIVITLTEWQQLKLSLQSSVALTNLMGKFPDLPDVEEAK